jgi:hypothetical protein
MQVASRFVCYAMESNPTGQQLDVELVGGPLDGSERSIDVECRELLAFRILGRRRRRSILVFDPARSCRYRRTTERSATGRLVCRWRT